MRVNNKNERCHKMAIPKRPSAAAFPAQKTTTAPAPKTEQTVDGWDDCMRGHFIGLHGTGGAGKSTLAAMLPGRTLFIDLEGSLSRPLRARELKPGYLG